MEISIGVKWKEKEDLEGTVNCVYPALSAQLGTVVYHVGTRCKTIKVRLHCTANILDVYTSLTTRSVQVGYAPMVLRRGWRRFRRLSVTGFPGSVVAVALRRKARRQPRRRRRWMRPPGRRLTRWRESLRRRPEQVRWS